MVKYIISKELKPCFICGKLTNQIDLSQARICSEECYEKFIKLVDEKEKLIRGV